MRYGFVCAVLCASAAVGRAASSSIVTFDSLLDEMVDRGRIARLPSPAYTCKQFSSYDRNSTEPGSPTWWANWDRSYFVRVEENAGRKEHVLMDAEGPGVVVRFWATWHGPGGGEFSNGTMRVYIDGQAEPVIEGPMADLVSGGKLVGEPLSHSVSPQTPYRHRGHNLYLPIPYAKRCKITYHTDVLIDEGARKGEALYYQINYRTYEPGTRVESFSEQTLGKSASAVGRVNRMLGECERSGLGDLVDGGLKGAVAPGGEKSMMVTGSRAIRRMQFRLRAEDLPQALRSTILKMEFDGAATVWCPIGDFFGTGYHVHPHSTWYTQVDKDGMMSSYWVMPFGKRAKVTVLNLGSQPVELVEGRISSSPWEWDERSCHFHAAWKQWAAIETQSNEKAVDHGALDLTWVTVQGQGAYVGDVLTLFNTADTWWGEGDEKIYVDGETFPSHIGTGSEDYYGYAWCRPEFFQSAFHAQPCGDGNLKAGFSVNSRYRALDAIPFTKSIQFDMELWHWARTKMNYAPATFWYARPGATSDVQPMPDEAARPVARAVEDIIKPRRVDGAIEGETLKVIEKTGGETEIQNIRQHNWSNNAQLWWRHAKEQDRLVVEFTMDEGGEYDVTLGATKAVDYGIMRIAVNPDVHRGTKVESIDFFNQGVVTTEVKLGKCRLNQGVNRLEVTVLGANPSAVKSYMFGLDYILAVKPQ